MIVLNKVSKVYETDQKPFEAVKPTSLHVKEKEIYGIIGLSGAGKSTLLRLVNLLEKPSSGTVQVADQQLTQLSAKQLRQARYEIGMIFQQFHLLANRTVKDNVAFPLELMGVSKEERKKRVEECLRVVELEDKANHYPAQLSGGQKQRVAIARALSTNPKVLLCDEPTSALDPQTTKSILSYLLKVNREYGVTILIVTHEMDVVRTLCDRVGVMENGQIVEEIHLHSSFSRPKSQIGRELLKDVLVERKEVSAGVR